MTETSAMAATYADELPIVAGHRLRVVVSQRWGQLIAVGRTRQAFRAIESAEQWARENPETFESLSKEYEAFCVAHKLILEKPADEHFYDDSLTVTQRLWLINFARRWQSVAEFESEQDAAVCR